MDDASSTVEDSSNAQYAEAYLRSLFDIVTDSIITINPSGIILTFNNTAEDTFHYRADEVVGHSINMLMPEPHKSAHDGYLEAYLTTGAAKIIGVRGRILEAQRKNGDIFPIELSVSEVKADNKHFFVGIIRDTSAQRDIEQALVNNALRLEAMMAAVVDGLITIDDKGIIFTFNPAAEKIFGYSSNEVIGKNIKILMPEPYHSEHDGYLKSYRESGHAKIIGTSLEAKAKRKDGEVFPMDLAVRKMTVENKNMYVGIVRDITEQKQIETEQEELIKELKRSNQELDDFAYIASHDLKEPLRGLFNNALFLQEDFQSIIDKQGIKRLNRMSFLCERMEKLIDNLLYFSRIGSQELAIQDTDINAIVLDVQRMIESYEDHAQIRIATPLPNIVCDHTRISEVFRNLFTNGIKYNNNAKKMIEIGYYETFNSVKNVFYVKDNGIGIAEEFHDDIFKIFKRLNVEDDNIKGSGVGLTFVKKIIERHKGKIWLKSTLGQGTTFYFTLNGESDE